MICDNETELEEDGRKNLSDRFIYAESKSENGNRIPEFLAMSSPRLLKSHLPYYLTRHWFDNEDVKKVVILRNPKDTLVSLYHFFKGHKSRSKSQIPNRSNFLQITNFVIDKDICSSI